MTTLVFVALARSAPAGGYTAHFPDLPGLGVDGADIAALVVGAREAVQKELQRLTDEGLDWPRPAPLEALQVDAGVVPFIVDVSVEDTPVRVNISIGERLLKRIDQAAETRGMSRSGFIASAARTALGEKIGAGTGADFDAIARKLQDEWSVLGRKITEGLGPNSTFNRNVTEFDNKVTETIRKTADSISAAMARRKEAEARKDEPAAKDQPADATAT
ncbi:type II toxin-antitoxin system HicB family antitoxin [Phenylobacterium sp.]|uniref:type II toxin-antitoxin system HicB family antitoxin n=1 Tax=Phenylobacterium sp. TaxID=1871053 RepID=UPI00289F671A|nr:type II toxin-antitoxin system HicB family antitoxin [Phenylobacterium sp.]